MKLNSYSGTVFLGIIIITSVVLYRRYEDKNAHYNINSPYDDIQKYLIGDGYGGQANKIRPIIWIPLPYEYNARDWLSFGSRSSTQLNQPYLYYTVKSIINQCDSFFNICIVDDNSFKKLLPGWSINLTKCSDPIKSNMRTLGLTKLLYKYGGFIIPPSFLCLRNLNELYSNGTSGSGVFICESVNNDITSTNHPFCPDTGFMGALKENPLIAKFESYIQLLVSRDSTADSVFNGNLSQWCNNAIENGKMQLINGHLIGTKDMDDQPIIVDNLLQNDYIEFYPKMYGINVPAKIILSRVRFEWYARLSRKQVLQANVILSKYILLSTGNEYDIIINTKSNQNEKTKNVSFWSVPLKAPVWGLKPTSLGGYVRKLSN